MPHRMITGGCVSQAVSLLAFFKFSTAVANLSHYTFSSDDRAVRNYYHYSTSSPCKESEAFRTSKRSSHKLGHRAKGQIIWRPTLLPMMDFAGNEKCKIFFQVLAENYYIRQGGK